MIKTRRHNWTTIDLRHVTSQVGFALICPFLKFLLLLFLFLVFTYVGGHLFHVQGSSVPMHDLILQSQSKEKNDSMFPLNTNKRLPPRCSLNLPNVPRKRKNNKTTIKKHLTIIQHFVMADQTAQVKRWSLEDCFSGQIGVIQETLKSL